MDDAHVTSDTAGTVETPADLSERDRAALEKVASLLPDLRFGTILLVIHDGEVVQVEAAEKIRMR